jgi:hypothetical protein
MASAASIQINIEEHYKQCVAALQQIAQLADTGSRVHKERFQPNGDGDGIANGWRVAEAMREIANDVVGSVSLPRSLFCEMDRVRIKAGRDTGHYGTVLRTGSGDGVYYTVKLDCYDGDIFYREEELEQANPDEPAWVTRFAKGKADCSPFVAKEIADQVREMLVYKRAMESMAKQFIHPKMTALEMAEMQLRDPK